MEYLSYDRVPRSVREVFKSSMKHEMSQVRYWVDNDSLPDPGSEGWAMIEAFLFLSNMLRLVIGPLESMGDLYLELSEYEISSIRLGGTTYDRRTYRRNQESIREFWNVCKRADITRKALAYDDLREFVLRVLKHSWPEDEDELDES